MNALSKLFKRKPKEKANPRNYVIGGNWGNAIEWFDWESRKVNGWKTPIPEVGDNLFCQMESGKICRFTFTHVKQCRDPRDMFFANVIEKEFVDKMPDDCGDPTAWIFRPDKERP